MNIINTCVENKVPNIEQGWLEKLQPCFQQEYMRNLRQFLIAEKKADHVIYPASHEIFNALNLTPFDKVKVVILGQDPYHRVGQAHGLSFSVRKGVKPPPSLVNIYKELADDLGSDNFTIPPHGDLTKWAEQGILLLNTVLTVRAHQAFSHRNQGWENFTDSIIKTLSSQKEKLIFVLWGSPAKAKSNLIDTKKHLIISAAHPSPLSAYRGFLGCKHFSKINQLLIEMDKTPIDWQV